MLSQWFLSDNVRLAFCLPYHHDGWLVAASYLVAVFAAYTAFHLIARIGAATNWVTRSIWLAVAGLSMGLGIWAMHFIAVLAIDIPIQLRFDLPLTAWSAGFAVLASALAFLVVTAQADRRIRLVAAGIVFGLGIGLMHYVGMAALLMQARIYYAAGLFALSLLVAIVLATLALALLTVLSRPGARHVGWARLTGALVMGLAITLMHYTGMFATYFYPEPGVSEAGAAFDRTVLAAVIGLVALLIGSLAMGAALFDRLLQQAEALLHEAVNSMSEGFAIYDANDRFVMCNDAYREFYRLSTERLQPGTSFETILRDGLAKGVYADGIGREEAWLAERLDLRRRAMGAIEQRLSNGSWTLITDRRMSNGGIAGLRVDITALKQAQAALRESEQRFRDFAELASDWFWEQDAELRFTVIGGGAPSPSPGNRSDLGKRRWEITDTSRAPAAWEQHKRETLAHLPFRDFRYERIGPNGEIYHISISGVPLHDQAGNFIGYRGIGRDITAEVNTANELRLAKERAEQAEALLSDAVDSISECLVIYDADDRLVLINKAYERTYPEAIATMQRGRKFADILRDRIAAGEFIDAIGREDEWFAERMRQHREAEGEYERRLSNDRWMLVSERRMRDGGIVGLRVDISALKQAQAALRDSEQRLDRAQEIAGIGSWEFDVRTGRRVWSREMYRIRGLLPDEGDPTIQGLAPATHPEDRDRFYGWLAGLSAGVQQPALEYRIIRPDGQVRIVIAEGQPIMDHTGAVIKVAGTLQDVTERRRTEQRLVQAQKMETLGQLTGGLAHDFNNILGAVIGNLDLAIENAAEGSDAANFCQRALDAALSANELVKRLLAFARRQALRPQPTNLAEVVASLLPLVERTLGERIQMVIRMPPQLWPVVADAVQLESALLNLVVNARDAMPEGGTLSIEAANAVLASALATASGELSPGDYALIAVGDTGTGMAPDTLAHAFDPFFTTKGPGTGTGLGLSMVLGTIQQLGGQVDIESNQGVGTTVRLYLPRSVEPVPMSAKPPAREQETPGGCGHILVVEDNSELRVIACELLESLGYRVTVAASGDEAMQLLTNGLHFDLLFTDIVMPGRLDGIALARELRARDPVVPILLTSGFSSPLTLRETVDALGAKLIPKPYRRAELANLVRAMLGTTVEAAL